MKIKITLIVLMILNLAVYAEDWRWQNPKPQSNSLWAVSFYNEFYGYAVGESGTIMFTPDGGKSWEIQFEAITDHLRSISVVDSITAFIAGDDGSIYATTNGGTNWNQQNDHNGTPINPNGLNSIFFIDRNHGWAAGDNGTILVTANSGKTWTAQTAGVPAGVSINSIYFIDSNNGFAVGSNGTVLYTSNGGTSWSSKSIGESTTVINTKVKFLNSSTGFILGSGGILYVTHNGGSSWSAVTSGVTDGLNDITSLSSTEYWISCDNGKMLHSVNSGSSWTSETFNTYASVHGVAGVAGSVIAVGDFGLTAMKSGSNSWSFSNTGKSPSVNWVTFGDNMHGYAGGQYGYMLKTTDGGKNWTEITRGITGDSFFGAAAAGKDNLWVVGDLGILLHTTDGGQTWTQQINTQTDSKTIESVSFVDQFNGWAVGDQGKIIHTTDGVHWTYQTSPAAGTLFGVKFIDMQNGWICGDKGLIMRTQNGGQTWTVQNSNTSNALLSVDFRDLNNGYSSGAFGTILKTVNGGQTWSTLTTPLPPNTQITINATSGKSDAAVWAVGDQGLVLFSNNGGQTWSTQFAATGYDLFSSYVMNDSTLWIGGDWGTILAKGDPSLVTEVKEQKNLEVPQAFTLSQNYPNPFNPSTTIKFSLPRAGNVTLKVYNILGSQVATLIDGFKPLGSYSVEFNAKNLPSGIYFYELREGSYSEIKKMSLLK